MSYLVVEVKNKRSSALIALNQNKYDVIDCSNKTNCKMQGLGFKCPAYCPYIVEAKKFFRGFKTNFRVEVLSSS